jgi:hypothetical protein
MLRVGHRRARAAALLPTLGRRDPERDRAFLHAAWQVALRGSGDRHSFVQKLQSARLPAIAQALGQDLAQALPHAGWPDAGAPLRRVALVAPAQAGLGEVNDTVVALAHCRALAATDPHAWFAVGWLSARHAALLPGCADALDRLARTRRPWPADTPCLRPR